MDVTNSQALRDIQNQRKVEWVMLVAPRIAIVVCNPYVTNLDTLKLSITVLDECNKGWGNRTVSQCAYYF